MKSIKNLAFLLLMSALFFSCISEPKVSFHLPSIIGSNMVLQQEQEVTLWGNGEPRVPVEIVAGWGNTANGIPDSQGKWQITIQTPSAGGPYQISITQADTTVLLDNVLIGEVWVCSGQSNMEMPLMGWPPSDQIMNSADEIANAQYPNIRLFTVTRALSIYPLDDCKGQWQECSPETARLFSATAYFFGKKLYQELGVPIGLIHTSWGGTPAESWVSKEFLGQIPEFTGIINNLESSMESFHVLEGWLSNLPQKQIDFNLDAPWANLDFNDSLLSIRSFNHSKWPTMNLPQKWEETAMGDFDGVIWFRKTVTIPESWVGKDLILSLGPIDDMDVTYANGHRVGGHELEGFWQTDRVYTIAGEIVDSKEITLAIRVLDYQGGGGIFGKPKDMEIKPKGNQKETVSIAGEWNYLPVAEYQGGMFYQFGVEDMQYFQRPSLPVQINASTPTLLYNAMIHPIIPFGIRGAIWYQGESNTDRPQQYRILFPLLIECWRDLWKQGDFPFYYVQISPYDYGVSTQSQLLREAQLKSLDVPNTGMAVTLDIGNPTNIHPANKTDVGERLALWALSKDYGRDVIYTGPIYSSMETTSKTIILSFSHADGGLKAKGGKLQGFQIAGSDRIFVPAMATIQNDKVIVKNSRIDTPVAVRYLWDNTSEATLFNGHGLPASSFRTDEWEE